MKRTTSMSLVLFLILFGISGCGGSGGGDDPAPAPVPLNQNRTPSISGSPITSVNIGGAYSFTPSASDPDDDQLTFSIQNLPAWASFDSSTGAILGTPALGDVGTNSNIVISVSDGVLNVALQPFAITVTQNAAGTAILSWAAPTLNEDGSALTDLSGYKIYYGLSQGIYPNQILVSNPGITTYVIDNLSPNTYFFVSTAINSLGIESNFSNVASKTVN